MSKITRVVAALVLAFASFCTIAPAVAAQSMTVAVDAREAVRGILHVRETIPVAAAGPLELVYPKWIPGEHSPSGPLVNLATLTIAANGVSLAWRRDPVDLYRFRIDVPAATTLDVSFDFLGASVGQYSSARLASPNILVLTWNKVLLTPDVADYRTLQIAPSIVLPGAEWQFATALDVTRQQGAQLTFAPLSEEMLVDSPLDAGLNVRKFPLGRLDGAPVELDVFADTQAELAASDATLAKFRNLVREMQSLYRARHFAHYDFLLTVSDVMPGEGVEHHQSSDDGTDGDFLIDDKALAGDADLLPHEFNHSWDGKYRRPASLATPNLQVPMQDDLLWVYEGMTQFYGELQAERSGLLTRAQWLDGLAATYAELDTTTGRQTRPLADTAVAASLLYASGSAFESARRSVDFYPEGALMWLEADVIIGRTTHGRRSIDDVARAFFGQRDSNPQVVTYSRDDVIAAFTSVAPYDWRTFFARRVDVTTAHPPDPFTGAGWRFAYVEQPNAFARLRDERAKRFEARYSLGIEAKSDGTVLDVVSGSPAANAGIGPGVKIVAIDGRALASEPQNQLDLALRAAQHGAALHLLVVGGDIYRDIAIDYHAGPRYPRLERVAGTPDMLSAIAAPRR